MTIGNGEKKEGNGILTKERPRFCKAIDVHMPPMLGSSSELHHIHMSGVKRSMVLFFKEEAMVEGANIVGVDCFNDGMLTIKRMNPTLRTYEKVVIRLTIMAL